MSDALHTAAAAIVRQLFNRHRKRFPSDEHVTCRIIEPTLRDIREDSVRVQVDRIRGYGIGAFYRHASADVPLLGYYYRNDKGALVAAFAEALDNLVRTVLRPDLPCFRIRRDARYGTHRSDPPTRRFASPRDRQA